MRLFYIVCSVFSAAQTFTSRETGSSSVCQPSIRQELQHPIHILLTNDLSYTKGNTFSDFIPNNVTIQNLGCTNPAIQ